MTFTTNPIEFKRGYKIFLKDAIALKKPIRVCISNKNVKRALWGELSAKEEVLFEQHRYDFEAIAGNVLHEMLPKNYTVSYMDENLIEPIVK